jgi:hypothetical protein
MGKGRNGGGDGKRQTANGRSEKRIKEISVLSR